LIDRLGLRSPDLQAQYVSYLLEQRLTKMIEPAVERVGENGRATDTPLLVAVCDRLIDEHRWKEALMDWNRLADARRIPLHALNPAEPNVTNGRFEVAPSSHGFDWRIAEIPGITISRLPGAQGIRIMFSGRQPENCEPLVQLIPVSESTRFELKFLYRTSGIASRSGLRWSVVDADSGRNLWDGESLSSENEAQQRFVFGAPHGTQMVRLALSYQRAIGTTRIEGLIALRDIQLNRAN
jgi:hypothetical protein